jgi:hypothetical protein
MADTVGAPSAAPTRPARRVFWLGVVVGAIAAAIAIAGVLSLRGSSVAANAFLLKNKQADGVVETQSGLQYKVLTPGKGPRPTDTDVALITYTGTLTDGTEFDKSEQPVPLAVSGVVPGFAEGLKLMQKGAKYRLWIKPELGYGSKAAGPIPANSVLVFDVTLVDFLPEAVVRQLRAQAEGQGAAPQNGTAPR